LSKWIRNENEDPSTDRNIADPRRRAPATAVELRLVIVFVCVVCERLPIRNEPNPETWT